MRDEPLTGHVALVTGGNAGIGLGMARGLAQAGATVVVWGTNEERNAAAVDALGGDAAAFAVDVSDEAAVTSGVDAVLDRFGRIDSCFANAGIGGQPAPIDRLETDVWRRILSVNLDGVLFTLRAAAGAMKRGGDGGSLVATSSLGAISGMAKNSPYAASKGAVISIVRALAVELARDGITVNAVLPGWIDTAMTHEMLGAEQVKAKVLTRIPARRWGTPEDFEAVAAFLAGPGARYITGQTIVIDGGYSVF